jgi:hypothetical protein
MASRMLMGAHIIRTEQTRDRPTFLWRPERLNGKPVFLEILPFSAERPDARLQLQEKPNFFAIAIL